MPVLILLTAIFGMIALFILSIPFSIVQRYRMGTARRSARGWVIMFNLALISLSAAIYTGAAAITNMWVPSAFIYSLAGLAGGGLLGLLGLAMTRWEKTSPALYFTPNRWLILVITLAVAARLFYGLGRAWQAWNTSRPISAWANEAGIAGSLAVGGIVLGYYLIYFAGVLQRFKRIQAGRGN